MDNETSVVRLRRKLGELSREYSKEKQAQSRSRSANSRAPPPPDPAANLRYRRTRRKVDVLRSPFDFAPDDNYPKNTDGGNDGTAAAPSKMVPTRDTDDLPKKKRAMINEEQNVVTGELIQVLHSKQKRIDELERRLKSMEQQESQWKVNYEQECNRCETFQSKIAELEQKLVTRKQQSKILSQLQIDVKRLHSAFNALELENTQLNAQLSRVHQTCLPTPPDSSRHDLSCTRHESLC